MLGLPKITEISKQLPKKAIYTKFQMNTAAKERIDKDISRITIVNEITDAKLKIEAGTEVKAFYVLLVHLKKKDFDQRNIATISRLIPQKMIMVLECENEHKLAIYHTKLIQNDWKQKDSYSVDIKGLNLDTVWDNIVMQIGGIELEQGNTLDTQIESDEKKEKLLNEIEKLEKQARNEKQPKKKFELVQEITLLKKEI